MRLEDKMLVFETDLLTMADRVRKQMAMAIQAIVTEDKTLALNVIEKDDYINDSDESINDQAIEILSLMQPVAKDLRMVVGGIKVSADLERIGDYAKNMGRYVIKSKESQPEYQCDVELLGAKFLGNFDAVVSLLKNPSVKDAYDVAEMDESLDELFQGIMARYASEPLETDRIPTQTIGILRNIERAGDHATNICEHVIYIVKGRHIDFG
ncbi:phosphate signaling complex protein PhoU [Erysipelothrix rhusiopathiae]|nr:phosphate signaling complex protein PhoU [Erysipelothrix rhusiopathiae]